MGFQLADPSAALGTESVCHSVLRSAGFSDTAVISERVSFTAQDVGMAWASNLGSAAHDVVRKADPDTVARNKTGFAQALAEEERRCPGVTSSAEVLFARGTR